MAPTWLELELAHLDQDDDDALDDAYLRAATLLASSPDASTWRQLLDRVGAVAGASLLVAGAVYLVAFNWAALGPLSKLSLLGAGLTLCAVVGLVRGRGDRLGGACLAAAGGFVGPMLAVHSQAYQTGADTWTLFAAWFVLFVPWAMLSRQRGVWLGALALLQATGATAAAQQGGDLSDQLLVAGGTALAWWGAWAFRPAARGWASVAATVGWLCLLGATAHDHVGRYGDGLFGPASWALLAAVGITQVWAFRRDLYLLSGSAALLCAWGSSRLLWVLLESRSDGLMALFVMALAVFAQAVALGGWTRLARGGSDALDA